MVNNKKNKKKSKPGGKPCWKRYVVTASIIVGLTVGVSIFFLLPPASKNAIVAIPKNATPQQLDSILSVNLGSAHTSKVMMLENMFHKLKGANAMKVEIPKGSLPPATYLKLARGSRRPVKVVINGFRTRGDLLRSLQESTGVEAEAFDSLLKDDAFLSTFGLNPDNADAMMLNYNHEVYYGSSPEQILSKIGKAYLDFWTEGRKKAAADLGLDAPQMVILASIVEEESNKTDERGRIGRLYINRLNKKMKLQADPTIRFALGDFTIKRVTNAMLNVDSPYNTYRNAGLPPGPIRSVDPATIIAILQSPPSDDLYMCAKADFSGYHNFASTYQEHLRNAEAYRKALDNLEKDKNIGKESYVENK